MKAAKDTVVNAAYTEMLGAVKALVLSSDGGAAASSADSGHIGGLIRAKYTPPGASSAESRIVWVCPAHAGEAGVTPLDGSATAGPVGAGAGAGSGGAAAP